MGRQRNASCSSGGNGTHRSQPAWTEQAMETRPGVPQNGGNSLVFDRPRSKRDPVHREGSGVPQNGGNGPPTVETGVLLIGRGVAYRKTDETDLLRSKRGSCSSGGVWRTAKRDSTGYCSSPPSTSSSLHGLPSTSSSQHGLLFIQPPPRATPPATVLPPLHRLLFIQPSTPRGPVQPPLHGHPSIVYCSSNPPHHGVLFIHRQRHRSLFIQPPPQRSLFIQRQHRSASVSSSSEGIARSGSVNSHRSIARVQ